jgi:MYXO-CTERM domain-containing protein
MPPTSTVDAISAGGAASTVPAAITLLGVATLAALPLLRRRRRP